MQAILVTAPGGPEALSLGKVSKPRPKAEELLVKVAATALNRADILQRKGLYPPPQGASPLLGLEIAGTVERVGKACTGWQVGDRVFGLLAGGGYAEYAVIHHRLAMPIPQNLSFEEAAAIPEAFLTAYQALYWLGRLEAQQRVLVHAGASGVGTAAIQLIRATNATPYITASASKHAFCKKLGAALAIDYHTEDFADRVLRQTKEAGVHLILDFIGGPYFEPNLRALSQDGTVVLLATMGGTHLKAVDLRPFFRKRATLVASTLRNRPLHYKIRLTEDFASLMLPLFATGRLKPVLDTVYHWKDVADAHRRMEANRNIGKLVLRVDTT